MPALHKALRDQLSKAILQARHAAEAGAHKALESLAVDHHEPHASMSPAERDLRRRLRARGRQLGDQRDPKSGKQTIARLAHEVAYEQWHRMLFARFLAENQLLIHPEHNIAVTLDEIEELARDAGQDPNDLAAAYAQDALPQIFRQGDPVLEVGLAPETRQTLSKLVASLPAEVFTADDALGWTYQFWQADKKDEVNKSGVKIGADELPAVTQLFTEHYMVLFLLHNTVGAWWAGKRIADLRFEISDFPTEQSCRDALALPGYSFDYLRFVLVDEDGKHVEPSKNLKSEISNLKWLPAAGTFDGWPDTVAELTVLDPCCGSGHFLVAVLDLLVRLHMEASGLSVNDAIQIVLKDNLFGLELDPRCTQIAAFNVALAAWKLAAPGSNAPGSNGPIDLPPLNIACSGLAPNAPVEQWHQIVEREMRDTPSMEKGAVRIAIDALHHLFKNASVLGSLINVEGDAARPVGAADWDTVEPYLRSALEHETGDDAEVLEQAVSAQGIATAARILAGPDTSGEGYTLVVTNVPYLGRGNQHERLKEYIDQHHKLAKADLATAFLDRALDWLAKDGTVAAVTPQNWLFLTSYKKFRQKLLEQRSWDSVARLGEHAFESSQAAGAFVALVTLSANKPAPAHTMLGLDVSAPRGQTPIYAAEKATQLQNDPDLRPLPQAGQRKNPDAMVTLEESSDLALLGDYAKTWQGLVTCNDNRFQREFWEIPALTNDWSYLQQPPQRSELHTGKSSIIFWEQGEGELRHRSNAHNFPVKKSLGRDGIAVQRMSELNVSLMQGDLFGDHTAPIIPDNPEHLDAMYAFAESGELCESVRLIDQQVKIAVGSLLKVPFDLAHWQKIAEEKYPDGLPEPESDDPTQWLFHGRPDAAPGTELQVAVARLLGYRWPAERVAERNVAAFGKDSRENVEDSRGNGEDSRENTEDSRGNSEDSRENSEDSRGNGKDSRENAEDSRGSGEDSRENAEDSRGSGGDFRGNGLEGGENERGVEGEAMRLSDRARALAASCAALSGHADDDGIVCLSATKSEAPAAQRLRKLLADAYGDAWSPEKEAELLQTAAPGKGSNVNKPAANLEDWLRDHFFEQHCKLFHHRPFVWHLWDGNPSGFHCLINAHRLCAPAPGIASSGSARQTLELITYTYLGDWITRQKADQQDEVEGADARLAAAMDLQEQLKKILAGEPPVDLFVRWKPLHEQAIGWEPDINDGVRMNIRPFMKATLRKGGKKGAGLLRWKPNIKWTKDRGKEPRRDKAEYPWFWGAADGLKDFAGGKSFDGNRWNDLHYTKAVKEAARAAVK